MKPDALQNGTYCFTIYDPSGKMVFESARYTPSEPAYITLENFAAGLYFIRLYNDNAYMESKKLMIIKYVITSYSIHYTKLYEANEMGHEKQIQG